MRNLHGRLLPRVQIATAALKCRSNVLQHVRTPLWLTFAECHVVQRRQKYSTKAEHVQRADRGSVFKQENVVSRAPGAHHPVDTLYYVRSGEVSVEASCGHEESIN